MTRSLESISRPRTVRFVTFGCKVNQYDTQVLRERALGGGASESDGDAEVIVVNTCTVTANGAARSRKAVRRLAREHPAARIYVTGCYAASDPEEAAALPNVAGVLPNERKGELARLLGDRGPEAPFMERTVRGFRRHTRAFVKIEDGCRQRCSYCIVPSVRPRVVSKRPDTAVEEVRDLVRAGYREVVLTGVHLGAYGREGPRDPRTHALTRLLRRLLAETGIERLRLSSIEANEISDELLDLVAAEPRLAPHLHLPLQSGSVRILSRMRRPTAPGRFLEIVGRVRERLPGCALGTDVIAGFPGERAEDFEATLDLLGRARFARTHVFPFSPRRGTPAASMPDPVPARVIRRRVARASRTADRLARRYAVSMRGRSATALVEARGRGERLTGLTEHYLRVLLDGPPELVGRLVPVRYGEPVDRGLLAEVISP